MVMALSIDQELLGSIPDFGILSNGELFYDMYGLGYSYVSMYCPVLSSEEAFALCWSQIRGDPIIVSLFLHLQFLENTTSR